VSTSGVTTQTADLGKNERDLKDQRDVRLSDAQTGKKVRKENLKRRRNTCGSTVWVAKNNITKAKKKRAADG